MEVNGTCRAIRRELLCLGNLYANIPNYLDLTHEEFEQYYEGNDFNVKSCKLIRRPDMLFTFPQYAVLIELDENAHKNRSEISEIEHLEVIKKWLFENRGLEYMCVLRINPDGKNPMFKKIYSSNSEPIWKPTEYFEEKMPEIFEVLKEWMHYSFNGTIPVELKSSQQNTFIKKLYY